ncbi:MAG: KTSC domain-containing protein [Patescibacteria group bacterium]
MDRLLVNSSNIITVGYDKAAKILEIEFQSGNIYQYLEVPEPLYQGLMTASSKGQYFHDNILKEFDFREV